MSGLWPLRTALFPSHSMASVCLCRLIHLSQPLAHKDKDDASSQASGRPEAILSTRLEEAACPFSAPQYMPTAPSFRAQDLAVQPCNAATIRTSVCQGMNSSTQPPQSFEKVAFLFEAGATQGVSCKIGLEGRDVIAVTVAAGEDIEGGGSSMVQQQNPCDSVGGRTAAEVESAVKIQAAARGRSVRSALAAAWGPVAHMDPPEVQLALEASSAMRIQALFRGGRVRGGRVRKTLGAADHGSALRVAIGNKEVVVSGAKESSRDSVGGTTAAEVESAVKIQAAIRGRSVRRALKAARGPVAHVDPPEVQLALEASSATRIQAVFRGVRVRKSLGAGGHGSMLADAIADIQEGDSAAKEAACAVRIQAAFRGLHARRVLAAQRQTKAPSNGVELEVVAESDHQVSEFPMSLSHPRPPLLIYAKER